MTQWTEIKDTAPFIHIFFKQYVKCAAVTGCACQSYSLPAEQSAGTGSWVCSRTMVQIVGRSNQRSTS